MRDVGIRTKFLMVVLILIFLLGMIPNSGYAQLLNKIHKDLSASITLDTNTKYIFRGVTIVDDPVFQPDVSLSFKGLTLGIWQNICLTEAKDEGGVGTAPAANEIDYYANYTYGYKFINLFLGWIYYQFPHTGLADTQELCIGIGFDMPLNPSVTVYRDVDDNEGGLYWLFSVSEDINVATLTFTPSIKLGVSNSKHSSYYAGVDMNSIHVMDMNFGLNVGIPLDKFIKQVGATINLHLNYSFFPDPELRRQIRQQAKPTNRKDAFYMGIGLSFNF